MTTTRVLFALFEGLVDDAPKVINGALDVLQGVNAAAQQLVLTGQAGLQAWLY